MRVHLCGVRGSAPVSGPEFLRYGGRTSCVAVSADGAPPTLVLDAGTGLANLARLLGEAPFSGSVLLGHLHWDHVMGLPFFRNADRSDARAHVYVPSQGDLDAEALLERMMSPPTFPIRPSQLRGAWRFRTLAEGRHDIEGFSVLAREIPHKGGRTLGFRVSDGTRSLAYLSDHDPLTLGAGPDGWGEYHEAACALADGVDLLIHDAQYTAAELPMRTGWGHPPLDYALGLAEKCSVGRLVLFHHDPERSDDAIDALTAALPTKGVPVSFAAEGAGIEL